MDQRPVYMIDQNVFMKQRVNSQRVSRSPRMKFSEDEDSKLRELVSEHGTNSWDVIAEKMKTRNIRQCQERWAFYLDPEINSQPWTEEEDLKLLEMVSKIGPKWVEIAQYFNKRTNNSVKNRFSILKKKAHSLKYLSARYFLPVHVAQQQMIFQNQVMYATQVIDNAKINSAKKAAKKSKKQVPNPIKPVVAADEQKEETDIFADVHIADDDKQNMFIF